MYPSSKSSLTGVTRYTSCFDVVIFGIRSSITLLTTSSELLLVSLVTMAVWLSSLLVDVTSLAVTSSFVTSLSVAMETTRRKDRTHRSDMWAVDYCGPVTDG